MVEVFIAAFIGFLIGIGLAWLLLIKKVRTMVPDSMNAHQFLIAVEGKLAELNGFYEDVLVEVDNGRFNLSAAKTTRLKRVLWGIYKERGLELERVLEIARENVRKK